MEPDAEEIDESKDKKLKIESNIQREAFELYYALGENRSLKAVALHFGKSERTIANWSRAFSWVDRCIQRTVEESDSKEKKSIQLDVKTAYRRLFNNLVAKAVEDFKLGKLRIKSISDLEKVAKMDLALIDSPIDNLNGEAKLEPEDREAIEALMETIKGGLNSLRAE